MLFSSQIFLFAFLPLILFLYYIVKPRFVRNIILTVASLFFYAWGEPSFVIVMIASIAINYAFGIIVASTKDSRKKMSRAILLITVAVNLALLGYYKYLDFAIVNINTVFGTSIALRNIMLPIGISFFTFQAMSYVFDIYRDKGKVQTNFLNVALYISFFPQLIAGPIVRYETISEQINDRKESLLLFSEGTKRFIIGLAKKILIANTMAVIADAAFNTGDYSELSVSFSVLGAVAYTLQIYYDFSGYSDMAIGLGKMFGFHIPENFNFPYISKSISEFWRRWHISLGTWFRDYVYFPLGGSRVSSRTRLVFNLLVVWLLTGIWHGASWNFVLWGLLYFVFIAFEKLSGVPKCFSKKYPQVIYQIITLLIVVFGWILFRSEGLLAAKEYFLSLFGANGNPLSDEKTLLYLRENLFLIIIAIVFAVPVFGYFKNFLESREVSQKTLFVLRCIYYTVLFGLFFISVSYMVKGTYNPFIYFNF